MTTSPTWRGSVRDGAGRRRTRTFTTPTQAKEWCANNGGGHVAPATFRKASYSGGAGMDCIELADIGDDHVGIRDSKDPHGPVLDVRRSAMMAFIRAAKAGEFDDLV